MKVNRQDISVLADTGATVDIVHSTTIGKLANKTFLQKSSTKIYACGFQTPLQLKGNFQATLESKQRHPVSQIYVIDSTKGNLLSTKTAQDLVLNKLVNTVCSLPVREGTKSIDEREKVKPNETNHSISQSDNLKIQEILKKYHTVTGVTKKVVKCDKLGTK